MKREAERNVRTKDTQAGDPIVKGQEHLELLRSSRHFKHVIRKEKFAAPSKLDLMLTRLYMAL